MATARNAVLLALVCSSANGFIAPQLPRTAGAMTAQRARTGPARMSIERDADKAVQKGREELNKVDAKVQAKAATDIRGAQVQEREVIEEAPIVKERIHEKTVNVDKTKVVEERIRTEVEQVIQPIKDEQRRGVQTRTVDHGTEVREHGRAGLDDSTKAELERRRQEVAQGAGTTIDRTTAERSERPDIEVKARVNVVEQVVPVLERDVYVPKEVLHKKEIVEIYHEDPVVKETKVEPAITKQEFEAKYGKPVSAVGANGAAASTTVAATNAASVKTQATTGTATKGEGHHHHDTELESGSFDLSNIARDARTGDDGDADAAPSGPGIATKVKNVVKQIFD